MKVLGIVAEYNPFHLGHKYHLEKSKEITNSDYSIAIMSGSFVQRGEPSFIDKWTKAKMAIDNGVDLVIELPFIFSTQSAELFALGSIKLLHHLNIVDYIAFGNESDTLEQLNTIAEILVKEPPYFKDKLRENLNKGYSFPAARSNALKDFYDKYKNKPISSSNIQDILKMSNNILAIEYLKALKSLDSKIQPISIKRKGSSYGEKKLNNTIASATAIRNGILNAGINSIKDYVPINTYQNLIDYTDKYQQFNTLNNYNQIIHYLLQTEGRKRLMQTMDIESGLENRIIAQSLKYKNVNKLVQSISTKRYPQTRIKRILIHMIANLSKSLFYELFPHYPAYLRVLGTNKKGFLLLKEIKRNCNLPIIVKFSDYKKYNNSYIHDIISLDIKATNLYFTGLNIVKPFVNMDYYTTPYIKK